LEEFYVFSFLFLGNPQEFKVGVSYRCKTGTVVLVE
jgi:hypothetical protein